MKRLAAGLVVLLLAADLSALSIRYYFSPECGTCREFIGHEIPRVEGLVGQKLTLEPRDIRLPGVVEELEAILDEHGLTLTAVPVLIVGETVLAGDRQITEGFEAEVRRQLDRK